MKKRCCLALLLFICLVAPAQAEASWTGEWNAIPYAALSDGTRFYLGVGDAVYACAPGENPQLLLSGMPYSTDYAVHTPQDASAFHCLLLGEKELLGVNLDSGMLYAFSMAPGQAQITRTTVLDFSDFIQLDDTGAYAYTSRPSRLAFCGGWLYALGRKPDTSARCLYRFDPQTGEKTILGAKNLIALTPYREGKLLAVVFDEENAWDEGENALRSPRLALYDPKTAALTDLGALSVSYDGLEGLTYDGATDTLYYFTDGRVWRRVGLGQAELCAYAPFSGLAGRASGCLAAAGGSVAMAGNTGWTAVVADPQRLPRHTVTILSGIDGDAHRAAAAQMGEIPVLLLQNSYANDTELFQALVTGELEADILCLRLSFTDVQRMMEKGYCLDLSASDGLSAFVDQAYPFLQEAVRPGGTLYAVPVDAFSYGLAAYADLFQQVGLEIPDTFAQLCQLLERWGTEGLYETYSDYQPFMWEDYRKQLVRLALSLWGDSLTAQGLPLTLDAPALKEALAAVDGLDVSDYAQPIDWEAPDAEELVDELCNRAQLMDPYLDFSLTPSAENAQPMLLSLGEGQAPWVGMEVSVMVVNPRSENREAAIRYLEYYCAALDETTLTLMQPGRNDPIPSSRYDQLAKNAQERVDQLRAQLKTASQADIPALEEQLSYRLAEQEELERYAYSATTESIAAYRRLMEHGFIRRPSVFGVDVNPELSALLDRYVEKQITLEQFIQEGEAKLRLMRLEE